MDMDQSAVFLAGTILTALGFVIITAAIVAVNNIIHRYWKPVRIFTADSFNMNPPARYATEEELAQLNKTVEPKLNK
jgi:hypothetical protein